MKTCINNTDTYTYFGLSTDQKPTNCPNGSCFVEMDTSAIFFFSEEDSTWYEFES